jgi:MFS transporter, PAT family, beta-lactamase induction signal transducer AmpG
VSAEALPVETQRRLPAAWKLGVLSTLYFVQGLPFGFQSKGLKLALTALGLSMTKITLAGLLSLPWSLKPLLAPFVDRHGSDTFGRRKSWIVPLQGALALACLAAGFCPPDHRLVALLVCVFFMNVFAAAQDVPVDGLAVDLLGEHELGLGNAIQVSGYKIGMIVGGSVLISQLGLLGWSGMFFVMTALCLTAMVATVFVKEPRATHRDAHGAKVTWRELGRRLKKLVDSRQAVFVLVAVATYKFGETLSDQIFEPWLVRVANYPIEQAASFAGWGMGGSLLGSALGGLLATRVKLTKALTIAAAVRCVPLFGMWAMSERLFAADAIDLIALTTTEHFFGGMLTTAMFAWMMSQVDKRIGATHFTLLAAVEVVGKSVPGLFAGAAVDAVGWSPTFLTGALSSIAFLALMPLIAREPRTA